MPKRTTIEIDEEILARARRALGAPTIRATVEEALRRVSEASETEEQRSVERQRRYLEELGERVDVDVLASEAMWR